MADVGVGVHSVQDIPRFPRALRPQSAAGNFLSLTKTNLLWDLLMMSRKCYLGRKQ